MKRVRISKGVVKMIMKNRLAVLMAQKEIRSVSELQRKIEEKGLTISRKTLDKFYKNESNRFDADTLVTLCQVLNCQIHDILYLENEEKNPEEK
jgi:putative transcriptional regulator